LCSHGTLRLAEWSGGWRRRDEVRGGEIHKKVKAEIRTYPEVLRSLFLSSGGRFLCFQTGFGPAFCQGSAKSHLRPAFARPEVRCLRLPDRSLTENRSGNTKTGPRSLKINSGGPRGPFEGPRGPLKGPRGPFKGPRGPFKRDPETPGSSG